MKLGKTSQKIRSAEKIPLRITMQKEKKKTHNNNEKNPSKQTKQNGNNARKF